MEDILLVGMPHENPEIINGDHIAKELACGKLFSNCEWIFHESVGSTNDLVRQRLRTNADQKIIVVCARRQTSGRGRGMNRWVSNRVNNIYLSFGFPTKIGSVPQFSQIFANKVVRCFRDVFSVNLTVKAPNDLLLGDRKVGGILLEVPAKICGWILGIGINLFSDPDLQGQCAQPVGAIDLVKNLQPDAVILELCTIVANLKEEMGKKFSIKM
ncbi:MAG: biotin--[acetyl-CoA-carboxylase] ligase [Puniceicoccales bacterium]|jgi:BirA family biotin operon repressor/biotin-[acetyl-CoA-carboxylase] ligase|nr:biotin--[acetyl-CoA-carboxylase] ligase [Puniceicoccales bacterium]